MRGYKKIILFCVGWVLFGALVYHIGVDNIAASVKNASVLYICGGLCVFACAQIVRGLKWSCLLSQYISIVGGVKLYFVTASYSIFSPLRVADFFVSFLLRENGIDVHTKECGKKIFAEKVIDFSVVVFFATCGAAFLCHSSVPIIFVVCSVCLLLFFFWKKISTWTSRIGISRQKVAVLFLLSFTAFVLEIVSGFLLIASVYHAVFWLYFFMKPLSILIGIITMIPAGLGVESYSIIQLLALFGENSVTLSSGIIIARIVTTFFIIIVGHGIFLCNKKIA